MPLSLNEFLETPTEPTTAKPPETKKVGMSVDEFLSQGEAAEGPSSFDLGKWAEAAGDIPEQVSAMARQTASGYRLDMLTRKLEKDPANKELLAQLEVEKTKARELVAEAQAAQTEGLTTVQQGVQSGIASMAASAPALVVGAVTRSPILAAAATYPITSWQAYSELIGQGIDPKIAARHSKIKGTVEVLTEVVPFGPLLKATPFGRKLLYTLAADIPGEVVATFLQGASTDIAVAEQQGTPITPGFVMQAVWAQRGDIPVTIIAAGIGSGIQSGVMTGVNRLAGRVIEEEKKGNAKGSSSAFDDLLKEDPTKAKEVSDHLGKKYQEKVDKWKAASEEELRKAGGEEAKKKAAEDAKSYEKRMRDIDRRLQRETITKEEAEEVSGVFEKAKGISAEEALKEFKQAKPDIVGMAKPEVTEVPAKSRRMYRAEYPPGEHRPLDAGMFFAPTRETATKFAPEGRPTKVVKEYEVSVERPFDYENPEHVDWLVDQLKPRSVKERADLRDRISHGDWGLIEKPNVRRLIREAGYDSYYVQEFSTKNIAVLDPTKVREMESAAGEENLIPAQEEPFPMVRREDIGQIDLYDRETRAWDIKYRKQKAGERKGLKPLERAHGVQSTVGQIKGAPVSDLVDLGNAMDNTYRLARSELQKSGEWGNKDHPYTPRFFAGGILGAMAKRSSSREMTELLKKIESYVGDVPVAFVAENHKDLKGATAHYDRRHPASNRGAIVVSWSDDPTWMSQAIIHESVHAAVYTFMRENPKHPHVQAMRDLMAEAKKRARKMGKAELMGWKNEYNRLYGLTNPHEFVAEVFSSPQLWRFLLASEKHASPNWKAKALVTKFSTLIKKMLGVTDPAQGRLLDDVVALGVETMDIAQARRRMARAKATPPAPIQGSLDDLATNTVEAGQEVEDAIASAKNIVKLRDGIEEDPVVYHSAGFPVTRADIRAMFNIGMEAARKIPGVVKAEGKLEEYWRRYATTFVPEALGEEAELAGAVVARGIVTRKAKTAQETTNSRKRRDFWLENIDRAEEFIRGFEKGIAFADRTFQEAAAGYRKWMQEIAVADAKMGIEYEARDNYMTHLFEDKEGVQEFLRKKYGKKWGDPYFMKDRTFEAYEDAIKHGFKPLYKNPEDIMMARQESSNIAHMRIQILRDLHENGLATPVKKGKSPPEGYSNKDIRSPDGTRYWLHRDARAIFHNAFETESMWTRQDAVGSLYRGGMNIKNTYVPIQLWGMFHAMHVGLIINNAAALTRASKSLLAGRLDANVMKDIGKAFLPLSGVWDKGAYRLLKAYWGKVPYDQLSDGDKLMMQFMNEGGMVPAMAEQDRISAHQKFFDSLKTKEFSLLTPFHAFATILRAAQYPMFHIWIPQMKIAAYAKDIATAIRLDPELMSDPKKRVVTFRRLAKSIDNRFGEMSYDTLFWNRTIKDIAVLNTLSLGWQMGFIREYLQGTTTDVAKTIMSEKSIRELARTSQLDRTLFTSFYMGLSMLLGGLMTYAFTGEPPEDLDYLLPRTGEKNPDGTDKRLNTPLYSREIASIWKHMQNEGALMGLVHLVKNKASGVIGLSVGAALGVDSIDREIRDPDAPLPRKVAQTLQFLFKEAWPISFEAMEKEVGGVEKALAFGGFTPAAKYLTESPIEGKVKARFLKYFGAKRTPYYRAQMSEDRRELRQAYEENLPEYDDILARIQEKYKLSDGELAELEANVQEEEKPYYKMFSRLPWQMQKKLLDEHWYEMTEEERDMYLGSSNVEHLRYDYEPPKRD